jgi:hypothetical protein
MDRVAMNNRTTISSRLDFFFGDIGEGYTRDALIKARKTFAFPLDQELEGFDQGVGFSGTSACLQLEIFPLLNGLADRSKRSFAGFFGRR